MMLSRMDKSLRRLAKLSSLLRNRASLSNHATAVQFMQYRTQGSSTSEAEPQKQSQLKSIPVTGSCSYNDPIQVLDMLGNSYLSLKGIHAVNVLHDLSNVYKENKAKVVDHVGFPYLCDIIVSNLQYLPIVDVITVLKALTMLEVPTKSIIMQALLQRLKSSLNELDLNNITFIHFLIHKLKEKCPLTEALDIALPIVFQCQAPRKIDSQSVSQIASSLGHMTNLSYSADTIDMLIAALLKLKHTIQPPLGLRIFHTLLLIRYTSLGMMELYHHIATLLLPNAKDIQQHDIIKFFTRLSKNTEWYNEAFVDALVTAAISQNISFQYGHYILSCLNKVYHSHDPLLNYLSAICFADLSNLTNCTIDMILQFMKGLIIADYKPVFWETLQETIIQQIIKLPHSLEELLELAIYLAALDTYDSTILQCVFEKKCEPNTDPIYTSQLLLLYQSVKTMYPTYSGPWPFDDSYIVLNKKVPDQSKMRIGLEQALGGTQYVQTNLKTKLGHIIDYAVVMRKGGYPVAINVDSNVEFVESLNYPQDSQVILIFDCPHYAYSRNSRRLNSVWGLKLKSVELLTGHSTVALNSKWWLELPDYEKIPYLMQAIKLKCDNVLVSER